MTVRILDRTFETRTLSWDFAPRVLPHVGRMQDPRFMESEESVVVLRTIALGGLVGADEAWLSSLPLGAYPQLVAAALEIVKASMVIPGAPAEGQPPGEP